MSPLNLKVVSSNVFTDPQIASVGVTQAEVDSGGPCTASSCHWRPMRAKMQGFEDGFVKIFCRVSGTVVGSGRGPGASELIYPLALRWNSDSTWTISRRRSPSTRR